MHHAYGDELHFALQAHSRPIASEKQGLRAHAVHPGAKLEHLPELTFISAPVCERMAGPRRVVRLPTKRATPARVFKPTDDLLRQPLAPGVVPGPVA